MTARRLMPFQESSNRIERARFLAGEFQARLEQGQTENLAPILRGFARELRAALDSTIVDIARVKSKDPEDARFPFADSAQQLSDLCDVEFRRIDEELADYLKALRPHRGGNGDLYLLHEIDTGGAAPGEPVPPVMEGLLRMTAEIVAELRARFGARV